MLLRYLTHPEVNIEPAKLVPQWGLNETGKRRVSAFTSSEWLSNITTIVSSAETKALQTAKPIARSIGIPIISIPKMHENDRSSTGYLPPDEFEAMADKFFAHPQSSINGWERAVDAQIRIVAECEAALNQHHAGDILFIGHGAVGTLLYCHFAGKPIDRIYDQSGAGNYFSVHIKTGKVLHHWQPMEQPPLR